MKRVLVTGANSYVGVSVEKYLMRWPESYLLETVDMINEKWREKCFSGYDVVFHVAGIAHSDNGRISKEKEELYYKVNSELAIETARKAKKEGVKQFVFMSSAIVYGESAPIGKRKMITHETPVSPSNCYGDSKVQAEKGILSLEDSSFKVVILRPPMIYGKGSKGNYPLLAKLAKNVPFFPWVNNCRSMLYIDNLSEFVRLIIDNEERGIFWPQNEKYSNTSDLVNRIALVHGKKVRMIRGVSWGLKIMGKCVGIINKAFGSMTYEMCMSEYKTNYRVVGFEESIERTES